MNRKVVYISFVWVVCCFITNVRVDACPFCAALSNDHDKAIAELQGQRAVLLKAYGENHPRVRQVDRELAFLQRAGSGKQIVPIEGLISEISDEDKDFVEISLGSGDGVSAGDVFDVARFTNEADAGDPKGRWLGQIKVIKVARESAVAQVEIGKEGLRVGDQILGTIRFKDETRTDVTDKPQTRGAKFDKDVDVNELAMFLTKLFRNEGVTIVPEPRAGTIYLRGPQNLVKTIETTARELTNDGAFNQLADQPNQPAGNLLNDTRGGDPAELRDEYELYEAELVEIVRELQRSHPKDAKEALKKIVREAFEARQKLQAAEIEQFRERLSRVEVRIRRREQLKDLIIERRVEELLNPDLKWEATTKQPRTLDSPATSSSGLETTSRANVLVGGATDKKPQTSDVGEELPPKSAQVLFARPHKMKIQVLNSEEHSDPLICPSRLDLEPNRTYKLELTEIPGRDGVELFPTIEIRYVSKRTSAYLTHNAIAVQFTDEDFDQVLSGNFVTKVVYLPKPEFQEIALAGIETLVSTRVDVGIDPVIEAERRGTILAVVRLGNRDPQIEKKDAQKSPTGKIQWLDRKKGVVWINHGVDDGIRRAQKFRVYPASDDPNAKSALRGTIEVTRIVSQHLSEARIVSEEPEDSILIGDAIQLAEKNDGDENSAQQDKETRDRVLKGTGPTGRGSSN